MTRFRCAMWTVFLACAGTEHLFSITTQSQTQHSRTLCTFFERIAPIASFSGGFCAVRRHLSSLDARGLFERDETRTRPRAHGPRRARGPRDAKQPNEHNAKRDWFIYLRLHDTTSRKRTTFDWPWPARSPTPLTQGSKRHFLACRRSLITQAYQIVRG